MGKHPVFSIITICYRRLGFLQEALGAMLRQTYPYIEIIIVSNGSTPQVYEYITQLAKKDSRVKIVYFKDNQYRKNDIGYLNRVCLTAGYNASTGNFIWYQSDDDVLADDYVEKMVALFEGNPDCTTAAGSFKCIDPSGSLLPEGPRISNYRPRYMPGHLLALSTLNRALPNADIIMYGVPGSIFAFRRTEAIRFGTGYHAQVDRCLLYGTVPFGITGFDETAILYWRRHEGQLNKEETARGYTGFEVMLDLLKEWQIEKRWKVYGKDVATYVARSLYQIACEETTAWFVINLYYLRFKACCRLFTVLWFRIYFWQKLPVYLWKDKRQFKYFMKPYIRRLFESWVWLANVPALSRLKEKAFK